LKRPLEITRSTHRENRTFHAIAIVLLFVPGCNGQRTPDNSDVLELRNLPVFETPAEFNSDKSYKFKTIDLDSNRLIQQLRTTHYFSLMGKLFETTGNVTVIGYIANDTGSPFIVTFDNDGNQISSKVLYENAMGDMGRYTTNVVSILPDRHIIFTDSTTTRLINAEGDNEIPGTDSLVVTHKKYHLSEKGIWEEIKQQ
jgi:hypothetical protein